MTGGFVAGLIVSGRNHGGDGLEKIEISLKILGPGDDFLADFKKLNSNAERILEINKK